MTKETILEKMSEILVDTFELEPDQITLDALLLDDLDLDSIDAVDLIVNLQKLTGKKINPESFKKVRTIQDVVDAIYDLMNSDATT